MDIEQIQLEKARIFAYWGFIGIMLPIAGIISGIISASILNRLVIDEDDMDAIGEQDRILNTAHIAIGLSAMLFILSTTFAIIGAVKIGEAVSLQSESTEQLQKLLSPSDDN